MSRVEIPLGIIVLYATIFRNDIIKRINSFLKYHHYLLFSIHIFFVFSILFSPPYFGRRPRIVMAPPLKKVWRLCFLPYPAFRSAPVKGISRHNGAPSPLFHGPLDCLAVPRPSFLPTTGSWIFSFPSLVCFLIVRGTDTPFHLLPMNFLRGQPLHPGLFQKAE